MGFAAPWVLLGLSATLIPILLHLFARREPPTVDFPAVRYLADTARIHQRRLNLQHLLLLIVRTLLIALLVLAAAGPTLRGRVGPAGGHQPGALVLVFDNSMSAAVTENGVPVLDRLRTATLQVLGSATDRDGVWLLPADGVIRRGSPGELRDALAGLQASPARLDLGDAVRRARELLATDSRPGEVVMVTDLQLTALSEAGGEGPLTVLRPGGNPPANAGIRDLNPGPMPWTGPRAEVAITLTGGRGEEAPVPAQLVFSDGPPRNGLIPGQGALAFPVPVTGSGWLPLRVELGADELRMDDALETAVFVAPPASVIWSPEDRFLAAGLEVLADAGRVRREGASPVTIGALGSGASVVMPPEDVAGIGALNRALAARGIPWRYGSRVAGPATTDSTGLLGSHSITQRHLLESLSAAPAGVQVTAAGEPWLVAHDGVVLLGSRMEPAWTGLPVAAEFVPFLDRVVNRLARRTLAVVTGRPGEPVQLPDEVNAILVDGNPRRLEGGSRWLPTSLGTDYLLRGADTVGILTVLPDARESELARAPDARARDLWPGVRILDLDQAGSAAFTSQAALGLRPWLLWLALALAVLEFLLAGRGGTRGGATD